MTITLHMLLAYIKCLMVRLTSMQQLLVGAVQVSQQIYRFRLQLLFARHKNELSQSQGMRIEPKKFFFNKTTMLTTNVH